MAKQPRAGLSAGIATRLSGVTEKDLAKSLGVVALTGILTAATSYIIAGRMTLPAEAAAMLGTIRIVTVITGFASTLVGFAVSTGIYHGASRLLGGNGNLKRMFALSGLTSLPLLAQHALRLAYYSLVNDPSDLLGAASGGILQRVLGVFNVWTLIQLVLVFYAVRENYQIKGWKPALVTLIPTLISVAFVLLTRNLAAGQLQSFAG